MDKWVTVLFAMPDKQINISVPLQEGNSVQELIESSGILQQCKEINLATMPVGIFGKVCKLDARVSMGDRIEIYRPLIQHPMDARRNRAIKV